MMFLQYLYRDRRLIAPEFQSYCPTLTSIEVSRSQNVYRVTDHESCDQAGMVVRDACLKFTDAEIA